MASRTVISLIGFVAILLVTCLALMVALIVVTHHGGTTTTTSTPSKAQSQDSNDGPLDAPTISKDWADHEDERQNVIILDPASEPDSPAEDGPPNGDPNQNDIADSMEDAPWAHEVRLPASVLPRHYDLYLFPDLQSGIFTGKVTILLDSREPRDYFLVHIKHLEIESTSLSQGKGVHKTPVDLDQVFEYQPNEFLVVKTKDQVPAQNYSLSLSFRGNLTRGIVGFYRSYYINSKGQKVSIATSKFQPTYARRAFPCLDEPNFKSTFSVTLVRPSERYVALSNMPVQSENSNSPHPGFTEVQFERSVPMVTYLTCFIVCDFEFEEKLTEIHQTRFRVYATSNQKERLKYALNIGANMTDFFENYFDIAYPLPKQDMIAIPDFVSGAMEHWGLITYRETNLLYDQRESSSANKQRVASVISHELAHQWFGNLVTLLWWDDLWLNEGFASYMEYKGVANYHADWDIESQFITTDLHSVMDLDATINSHPIIQPVEHPDQINEIFDVISYNKGAAILRMLENFMGATEFKLGIHRFLKRFEFGHAVTRDLWEELEKVSSQGLNITHIMDTWTRQMGYPLITVERVKSNVIRLRQSRYLLDPSLLEAGQDSAYNYKWEVPITYISSNAEDSATLTWLGVQDPHLELVFPSGTTWVKFNVGQFGMYRVNYPEDEWLQMSKLLLENHKTFSTTDRGQLINDAFSLAESGHLSYSIPLSLIEFLQHDSDLVPWESAYKKITALEDLFDHSYVYPQLRKYIRGLVSEQYRKLGWRDDGSHTERLNRINVLHLACRNGLRDCLIEAGDLFLAWIKDKSAYIPPNLRSIAYRFGMASKCDEDCWSIMMDRYLNEENVQEKAKLLYGLAWNNQPWVLERFLRMAQNDSIVRAQDFFTCLRHVSQNPIGSPIVWQFLRNEWPNLVNKYSLNDRYLGRLPKLVSSKFKTDFMLNELKDFFHKYPESGAGSRSRKQAIEAIENNIKWLNRNQKPIEKWLLATVH